MGEAPVTSFAQITSNVQLQQELQQIYGSVDNVELFVGLMAEDHLPGSSLGPTEQAMLADQFEALRDGDRFFYENADSTSLVTQLNNTTLADIIERNTGLTNLQPDVFFSFSGSPSVVVGRELFYDNSKFDDNAPGISVSDDNAIATDKTAYLPGTGTATSANVSSYSRGINGIMIDLQGAGNHDSISLTNILSDFTFKMGNNNTPSTWATAPSPISVAVRAGVGVDGSDRVELIWADNAIKETWLEVEVLATADTGLPAAGHQRHAGRSRRRVLLRQRRRR